VSPASKTRLVATGRKSRFSPELPIFDRHSQAPLLTRPARFRFVEVRRVRPALMSCVLLVLGALLSACGSSSLSSSTSTSSTVSSTTTTSRVARSYITPSEVPQHLGQVETVRFTVGYTHTDSNGTEFLDQYQDYTSGFIVTIYASSLGNFSVDPASTYLDATVDVTGQISTYDGYNEILNPTSIVAVG